MSRSETPAPDGRRFPLLTEATMTPRQRESYQKIVSGPPYQTSACGFAFSDFNRS